MRLALLLTMLKSLAARSVDVLRVGCEAVVVGALVTPLPLGTPLVGGVGVAVPLALLGREAAVSAAAAAAATAGG